MTAKVVTDEGLYGLGDATLNGREMAVVAWLEEHVAPCLIGRDPQDIEDIWHYLYRGAYWRRGPVAMTAIGAIDMALWDIKGKAAGMPVYQLLGGRSRSGVGLYAHANGTNTEETLCKAGELVEAGFRAIRIQSAIPGLDATYGVLGDKEDYYELQGNRPLPPEEVWSTQKYFNMVEELIQNQLIDYIRMSATHAGGITAMRRIADFAGIYNVRTAPHGAPDLSPVCLAAHLHLDTWAPNFGIQEFVGLGNEQSRRIFKQDIRVENGMAHVSEAPGLGISFDQETAKELYELAVEKGVKTAYAASFRYEPHVMHARRLVAEGAIGEPLEVECISHFNLERAIPFGWSHRKEDGGGRLNNNFTHKLSIVTSVVGEKILSVMAEVRDDLGKAPIVKGVHNFKTRREHIPEDMNDPHLQWGESNVEWTYTVLAQLESEYASKPVSVLFKHGGLNPRFNEDHIVFYGSTGAIYIKGHYGSGPLYLYDRDKKWREVALPAEIAADVPDVEGATERNWRYLIRELVRHVSGDAVAPYQTFREGSQYQQLIDIIRQNGSWVDVRHLQ